MNIASWLKGFETRKSIRQTNDLVIPFHLFLSSFSLSRFNGSLSLSSRSLTALESATSGHEKDTNGRVEMKEQRRLVAKKDTGIAVRSKRKGGVLKRGERKRSRDINERRGGVWSSFLEGCFLFGFIFHKLRGTLADSGESGTKIRTRRASFETRLSF